MRNTLMNILYTCPICRESYETIEQAMACMEQPVVDCGWKPGEFLLIPQCAKYFEPVDHAWIAFTEPAWPKASSHFDHKPKWHVWYQVLGLTRDKRDPHRVLVVVATGGTDQRTNYEGGWNPADGDGHYGLYRPGDVNGMTAKNTTYHMPEHDCQENRFIMKKIETLRPPKGIGFKDLETMLERYKRVLL